MILEVMRDCVGGYIMRKIIILVRFGLKIVMFFFNRRDLYAHNN